MLVEQDVAPMRPRAHGERLAVGLSRLDHQGVSQRGLGDLLLTRRAPHAVRRERGLPIRLVGDLGMAHHVIVGAGDDQDAVAVGVISEALEIGNDLLGVRHVQLAVGVHEIVLRVDVPEDHPSHTAVLEGGEARGISWGNKGSVNRQTLRCRDAEWIRGSSESERPPSTPYNLNVTAVSSQQLCLGQRAQSAHTLSGKCSFSAGTKASLRKNAGLRRKARNPDKHLPPASPITVYSRPLPTTPHSSSRSTALPPTYASSLPSISS